MRTVLYWLAALYVFAGFYYLVAEKENLLAHGQTVYLATAPLDPRSPLQGDYMALNYAITNDLNHRFSEIPRTGQIVIQLDEKNIGTFVRLHQTEPLAAHEHLLKYHHVDWRTFIGAEAYFIPEGKGDAFVSAQFAELKVEPDGQALLVALCDEKLHRLQAK